MSRKDFDLYFRKVASQYQQLNEVLQDLSAEVNNNMCDPQRLEQLRATILPVKNSYDTLNYIRYLLDKPTRKSKHRAYDRQNKDLLSASKGKTSRDVIENNDSIIRNLQK